MEKHLVIKQQFFDLLVYLNSTNLSENETLQMYFYIKRVNNNNLVFAAISNWQKISLAQEKRPKHWVPTENTNYKELEQAISLWMPECLEQIDLSSCIKKHIFSLP